MSHRRKLSLTALLACALLALGAGVAIAAILRARDSANATPLARAKARSPGRYQFALARGARIVPTPDRRSFYVAWPATRRGGKVIVTLHGYFASAIDDFSYWYRYAQPRGYSLIALQWRLGPSPAQADSPQRLYGQLATILRRRGVRPGNAVLHGYSSSAVRTYALTALDRRAGRFFALTIANAGGAIKSIPLWHSVFEGGFGPRPLSGSRWVLWCGGHDRDVNVTGCPAMRRTAGLVTRRGGRVARLIVEPGARHGGFLANPRSVGAALAAFSRVSPG